MILCVGLGDFGKETDGIEMGSWQPRKGDVSPRKEIVPEVEEWDEEEE
jgi:hypothetical protein